MPIWLLNVVVAAVVLSTVLFACVAGGRTERVGAAIFVTNIGLNFLVAGALPILAVDLATALAFGALALSAPDRLWPGVAGVGQTLVVVFSATRMLDYPLTPFAYTAALNLASISVEVALVAGTCACRWGGKLVPQPRGQYA